MIPGRGFGIVRTLIGDACGESIADHLYKILHGHLISVYSLVLVKCKIYPVLEMMLVSALMMKPRGRAAVMSASFHGIGGLMTVKIPDAYAEFGGRKFRQIVQQSLFIQTAAKTAACNVIFMFADSLKMSEKSLCKCH